MTKLNSESIITRYRPKHLGAFLGNEKPKNLFNGLLLRGETRQGFLVSGDYGCGKTSFAAAMARAIACLNRPADSLMPCGVCGACAFSMRAYSAWGAGMTYRTCPDYTIDMLKKDLEATLYAMNRPIVLILDEFHRAKTQFHEVLLRWLDDDTVAFSLILCTVDRSAVELPLAQRLVHLPIAPPSTEELVPHLADVCRSEGFDIDEATLRTICAEERNVPRTCLKRLLLHAVAQPATRTSAEEEP